METKTKKRIKLNFNDCYEQCMTLMSYIRDETFYCERYGGNSESDKIDAIIQTVDTIETHCKKIKEHCENFAKIEGGNT